jgi:tetratricopeptide (TPR) repeat protein
LQVLGNRICNVIYNGNATVHCCSLASFKQAIKFQPDLDSAWYHKACCYALEGNVKQAIANLQQAIYINLQEYQKMAQTNPDFDSIRNDEQFQALLEE